MPLSSVDFVISLGVLVGFLYYWEVRPCWAWVFRYSSWVIYPLLAEGKARIITSARYCAAIWFPIFPFGGSRFRWSAESAVLILRGCPFPLLLSPCAVSAKSATLTISGARVGSVSYWQPCFRGICFGGTACIPAVTSIKIFESVGFENITASLMVRAFYKKYLHQPLKALRAVLDPHNWRLH